MGNLTEMEKLVQQLAQEIAREYEVSIQFWLMADDIDSQTKNELEEILQRELSIITEKVYKNILDLMCNLKERKKYLFRKRVFRDGNIVVINKKTGCFDNLLPEKEVKYIFSTYYIYLKEMLFEKI